MVTSDAISRIYVGNLPNHVSSRDVENEFRKYGNIVKCDVKKTVSGAAFAFIEFEDARDAADAIKEMHGIDFEGNKLRVEVPFNARENGRYNPRGPRGGMNRGAKSRRGRYVIEVTGLPLSGSWQDLKDHLRDAGECGHADVFKDGTGEVSFFSKADMLEAIERFNGSIFRSHEGEKSKITIRQKDTGRYDDDRYGRHSIRNRSYSSRSYSRSDRKSYPRSYSRSNSSYSGRSRSRSRSRRRSSSSRSSSSRSRSRSRSMERRRDTYGKKRGSYSRSLSYREKRRNNRSISKRRSCSDSRSSSGSYDRR